MPSALTIDYQALVRDVARKLSEASEQYGEGTITVAAGTVTLTGGIWPAWAASGAIQIGDSVYAVASRTNDTVIVINPNTVTVGSPTRYVLVQTDLAEDKQMAMLNIRDLIRDGYMKFCYPPAVAIDDRTISYSKDETETKTKTYQKTEMHTWSFLRPHRELAIVQDQTVYPLPDDFADSLEGVVIFFQNVAYPLQIVPPTHLRMIARNDAGLPVHCAHRPVTQHDPTQGQLYELVLDCPPDRDYTATFRYVIVPEALNPTNRFPLGGAVHGETIRAAVLAEAERYLECKAGSEAAEFAARLQASLHRDKETTDAESISFAVQDPIPGSYEWLSEQTALAVGESPNFHAWGHTLRKTIDAAIQQGYRMYLKKYQWSFLRPPFAMTLNAPYSTGTIGVVDGLATLDSGTWPSWSASGEIIIGNARYKVVNRISDSQIQVDNATLDVTAGTGYSIYHSRFPMWSGFGGLDAPLIYLNQSQSLNRRIRELDQRSLWSMRNYPMNTTGAPMFCALEVGQGPQKQTTRELVFWPLPDREYSFQGTARTNAGILRPGEMIVGGEDHYSTVLALSVWAWNLDDGNKAALAEQEVQRSIEVDQTNFTPETVGLNLDSGMDMWRKTCYQRWHYRNGQYVFGPWFV